MKWFVRRSFLVCLALAMMRILSISAEAQVRRPTRPGDDVRTVESRAQEARQTYLTQLADLAKTYEAAGDVDKAQATLREILKITPDNDGVRNKLRELGDKVFDENQRVIEIDSAKGWFSTGLKVMKGEPIRITAEGSYKFIVTADVGPDGFPSGDVMREMSDKAPCGALMATIVPEPTPRNRTPQPIEPFAIGGSREVEPEVDGLLLLRLNIPPNSKCIGKVKARVAGNIKGMSVSGGG